jgi:CheY-like chemotaxis protein
MLKFLRATVPVTVTLRHTVIASPMIDGDQTQLYQIVLNLCANAAHAIGSKSGLIEVLEEAVEVGDDLIAAHPDLSRGPHLRVSIRDDGCGMAPEVMQRIFEPFFTTKSLGQGTGLGLSVVHGILKSHKAAITVYSRPEHGAVFRLYFPAKTASGVGALAEVVSSVVPRGAGQRIVLVDDEVAITQVAERLLRALGYEVIVFHQSEAACAHLQREGGDLLISDFSMPGFGAFELIRRVRAFAPMLPVIVISGFLSDADRAEAGQIVSLQIVDKPLTTAVLGQVIARVFKPSGNSD